MSSKNFDDVYSLSPMQKGMLFHSIYSPGSGVYVEQVSCELSGSFDKLIFKQVWQKLLSRHTILRTGFLWEDFDLKCLETIQDPVYDRPDVYDIAR